MKYAILIYEPESDFAARTDPARPDYWPAWQEFSNALTAANVIVGGQPLQPPGSATTVKLRDSQRLVQDGPYAESREQLGGFMILDVPDLDAALEWAARCPAAKSGAVEVRPILPMDDQP